MMLRVVGGPRDGERVRVRDDVQFIKLIDPRGMMIPNSPSDQGTNRGETCTVTTYTKRCLRGPNGWELHFLAPENWSDHTAIEHQFGK